MLKGCVEVAVFDADKRAALADLYHVSRAIFWGYILRIFKGSINAPRLLHAGATVPIINHHRTHSSPQSPLQQPAD
jgi:hypothetical protein